MSKFCRVCNRSLSYSNFYKDSRLKDGYESTCKSCKALAKLTRRKRKEAEISELFTVYGYLETITGEWHYIGCTCRPTERRYEHEKCFVSEIYGRYNGNYTYHIFCDGLDGEEGHRLESKLIKSLQPRDNIVGK